MLLKTPSRTMKVAADEFDIGEAAEPLEETVAVRSRGEARGEERRDVSLASDDTRRRALVRNCIGSSARPTASVRVRSQSLGMTCHKCHVAGTGESGRGL